MLALLAVLALAGCRGDDAPGPAPGPAPTPRPPTDEQQIGTLLDRRADRLGAEVSGLGVRDARYAIEDLDVRRRSARVRARLVYEVRGLEGEFGTQRTLVVRRERGRWKYTRTLGARAAEPWEVDDYRRERSAHFVVWAPEGVDAPTDALEAGYARLGAVLNGLERRYLVVVARDGDAARAITREIEGLESLTAVTDTQVSVSGPALRVDAVRSQRLIVVASAFASSPSPEQVITHELAHAVLAPRTSARTPSWLNEGVALFLSDDDRRADYFTGYTAVPTLAGLAAPTAIGRLTGDAQAAGYATASAAAFYIADTYGEDALLDLLAAFNQRDVRGPAGDPLVTDRALRLVFGIGLRELQRRLG
ncbi:MAG: hypothetical protein WKF94_05780 [Solirubrobacteraceae bacterium]